MTKRRETTTFDLGSEKVARLLRIGAESHRPNTKPSELHRKAELLRDRLAETVSLYDPHPADLSTTQTRMSHKLADLAGEPIGRQLLDPAIDLAVIRRIKNHGRKLAESARSKPQRRVASTIYYAAIAAALLFHGTRITSHSYADLGKSLRRLMDETWISPSLTELFRKASAIIEEHHRS